MAKRSNVGVDGAVNHLRTPINRKQRLVTYLLRKLLRKHKFDFQMYGSIAAIIGDTVSDQIRLFGRYENEPLRYLALKFFNDNKMINHVCLDVGANIGNHAIFFQNYFHQVVAFEPNPIARRLLEVNIELNNVQKVRVLPVGLADRAGSETLSICRDNLGASRLSQLKAGQQSGEFQFGPDVDIQIAPGDSMIDEKEPVGFIKIDVEGMELQVLEGLAGTIRANKPLIMLEQLSSAITPGSGKASISEFMQEFGYRAYEIRPMMRTKSEFLHNILIFCSGEIRYSLIPVDVFEKRDYPVLILMDETAIAAHPKS